MTRRRRINTRVLHVEEVDNIKYVCKCIPEIGTFYVFGVLNNNVMGNNKRKKYKNPMNEKSKEVVDSLDRLFGMVPNSDWFTNNK